MGMVFLVVGVVLVQGWNHARNPIAGSPCATAIRKVPVLR